MTRSERYYLIQDAKKAKDFEEFKRKNLGYFSRTTIYKYWRIFGKKRGKEND